MSQSNRRYASAVRDEQAALTRHRVVRAAVARFHADGYGATTVAAIARDASVSAQTVYNAFGTKAALLKAAYDVTLAGDDDPVPLAERPEVKALYAETDAATFLRGYAELGRTLLDRVGPLMLLIAAGADHGDLDLVELRATTDTERLRGTAMVVARVAELGGLSPALTPEAARDRIWALNSVQLWHLLTGSRGWSGDDYAAWIGDAMCAAVLDDAR